MLTFSNGHSMSLSNGNSFSREEGTERECPLWRFVLRVVDGRP